MYVLFNKGYCYFCNNEKINIVGGINNFIEVIMC